MKLLYTGLLMGSAACVYGLIIATAKTVPISDFQTYYEAALTILNGQPLSGYLRYFQAPGYPYWLAGWFALWHSHSILLPQYVNAGMCTLLVGLSCTYPLTRSAWAIVLGAVLLAFNLNILSLVSVLCAEIPYIFFLLLGFLCLSHALCATLRQHDTSPSWPYGRLAVAGIALGLSQVLRPTTTALLCLFSGLVMLGLRYTTVQGVTRSWPAVLRISLRLFPCPWLLCLGTAGWCYWLAGYGVTTMPVQKGLWNMYVGLNVSSAGHWNPTDAAMIVTLGEQYQWQGEAMNAVLQPLLYDRIRQDWLANLQLVPTKLKLLLNPVHLPQWALSQSPLDPQQITSIAPYFVVGHAVALTITFGALGLLVLKHTMSPEELVACSLAGTAYLFMIVHAIVFEIQPRYSSHLWMLLFWCVPCCAHTLVRILQRARVPGEGMPG